MQEKEFRGLIVGRPFTPIVINGATKAPILNDRLIDEMLEMEECGFRFGFDIHQNPLWDPPDINTREPLSVNFFRQQHIEEAVNDFLTKILGIRGSPNLLWALKTALLIGIDNYLEETGMGKNEIPTDFFSFNGLLNQIFPLFLLGLSREERKFFWVDFPREIPGGGKRWTNIYCGAVAVARVAYGFRKAGLWLPPIYYDLHFSGDLVVRSDAAVFYIQIKAIGGNSGGPLTLTVLRERPQHSARPTETEQFLTKLWTGTRQFGYDLRIPVIPVLAEVNLNANYSPWEIEECSLVHTTIAHFLDSFRP